ncbi:hypothetical protein ADG881_643 [Alcanivorax sp. DG881]|nr:hypothetical protein ADG881_643 [Alcanivorax sp. DG881]
MIRTYLRKRRLLISPQKRLTSTLYVLEQAVEKRLRPEQKKA